MDLFTSVSYEIELWNLFADSRGANATIFLATVIVFGLLLDLAV